MAIEVLMPALSPTMTEGNLVKWLKQEGDKVSPGDVLAEIETDKATMEVESIDDGILKKIMVPGGTQGVKVNQRIALLMEEGDTPELIQAMLDKKDDITPPTEQPQPVATATKVEPAPYQPHAGNKIFASPLARRIAADRGIDLSGISGSGPHGRIVKADLENVATRGRGLSRITPLTKTTPHSSIRKVIAKRLLESKQQVPHFYVSMDCNLDALLAARQQMNQYAEDKSGKPLYKISVNDMIIKAVAMALQRFPHANASWQENEMVLYNNVDISVAVAIDDGLITPIVSNADGKDLVTISNEMKGLIAKAKAGQLKPEEFQGGGFTISNLGMYGVKQFNAIVNPPQACILAVGSAEDTPVVQNGQIISAKVMTLTLSCDHRVVDGALAAQLLGTIKQMLECPVLMFI